MKSSRSVRSTGAGVEGIIALLAQIVCSKMVELVMDDGERMW